MRVPEPDLQGSNAARPNRWLKPIATGLTLLIVAVIAATAWFELNSPAFPTTLALDFGHYLDGTRRWLATGTPYLPAEVAAPFQYQPLTFMHPPLALLLFAPFLVLPAVLWWVIPIGITAVLIVSWRPAPWAWPVITLLLALPKAHIAVIVGNTDLWVLAAIAAGLRFGWPALLVVIKPSLFPFVLSGVRHRSWWLGLPVLVLLAIPFGSLWVDWLHVVVNAPGGVAYSLPNVPWLLVPVVAWVARRTPDGRLPPVPSGPG
jgi:hypothetical protein